MKDVSLFIKRLLKKKQTLLDVGSIVNEVVDFISNSSEVDFFLVFEKKGKSLNVLEGKKVNSKDALKLIRKISKGKLFFDKDRNITLFSFEIYGKELFFIFGFRRLDENIKDRINIINSIIPLIENVLVFNSFKNSPIVSYALHRMIWDKNKNPKDYEFIDVNEGFELLTGLKRKDIVGKTVKNVIKGIDRESFIEIYAEGLKKGKELVFERFSKKSKRHYLIDFKPLSDDLFITIFYDITRLKEAQKFEISFYKWYKSTFETNNVIKLIIDPENGKIVDANDAALRFYGYTKDEILKKGIQDINILKEGVFECIKKVLNGYVGSFDFIHKTKNGSLKNVKVYPSVIEKDEKKYIYFIIFDVTEEIASRKKIEMLFEMMDRSIDEFYLLDSKNYRFLYVNETAIRNLGYSKEELYSMTPSDIAPEYTKKKLDELFKPFKEGELNSKTITTLHKRKDGSMYPVKVNLTRYLFDEKLYFFAVVEDITKEIEKEKKLETLNRLYYTLSQANQFIVRSKNEKELFEGLSRIIVEFGGFSTSFFLKKDKNDVGLVSFYGVEENDIKEIISITLKSKNRFITKKAILFGKSVVDNNYSLKVKGFEVFKKTGVKSAASFPIRFSSECSYFLTIYSNEPNFFTKDTIKLIEELCMGIEYALLKMDFEKKLSESEKRYKAIFENSSAAMCLDEILYDESGNPQDYVILDVNKAFEKITGLRKKDVVGKTSMEVYGTKNPYFDKFVDVVKNRTIFHDEIYFEPFNKYINISVSSFSEKHFSMVFTDVSDRYYYSQALEKLIKTVSNFDDVAENNIKLLFELLCDILKPDCASYFQYNENRIDTIYLKNKGSQLSDICKERFSYYISKISHPGLCSNKSKICLEKGKDYFFLFECVDFEERKFIMLYWKKIPANQKQIVQLVNIIINFMSSEIQKIKVKRNLIISNQKYQNLLNNQLDAVCLWKPDTEVVLSNNAYNEIHGFDIVGKKWIHFVPQEYKDVVLEKINQILTLKKPIKYDHPTITKDGKIRWYEWIDNPIIDDKGDIVFIQSNGRDITDKKVYEVELLKLKTIIEQAPIEIILTDSEGNIEYVNPYFEEITGYTKKEVIGKTPRILKSGKYDDDYYKKLWQTIKSGSVFRDIMVNKKKDGSFIYDYTIISPLKDEKGRITNFVGIKRDITKELEEERAKQHSQRMELIGTLAGGVAHDFNNILTSIMGNAEILLKNVKDEDAKKDILEIINSSQKAASLIKNLLHFAKKQPFELKVFDLRELVASSKDMLSRLIGEKYELSISCKEKLYIKGDFNSINQVLINLVVNAKEAMPNGGTIEIGCYKKCFEDSVFFKNFKIPKGCYAVFYVKDYGIGIDDEIKDKIFSPFFTTKEFGTGLGLSTAYSIVKRHMGYIIFDSIKNKGSEFKVYLPLCEEEDHSYEHITEKSLEMEDANSRKGYKIVFVDDDEGIRRMAKKVFNMIGFEVEIFEDPKKVIEYVEKNSVVVDILITDVIMKSMNGKELVEYLRSKGMLKNYIFISGYSDEIVDREGIDYNSDNFLSKPFKVDELKQKIERILKNIN